MARLQPTCMQSWRQLGSIIILILSLALAGCGPGKKAQCQQILQMVQEAESGRIYGNQDRDTHQAHAQLYQTLADELASLDVHDVALQERRTQLVEAYSALAISFNRFVEHSNEDGQLSYVNGDSQGKALVDEITAEQMQAYNRVTLAMDLFYGTCSH